MRTGFVAGINLPPVRAYVHKAGFEEVYHGDVGEARSYLMRNLNHGPVQMFDFNYLIAAVWGDPQGNKVIDFFGYSDVPSKKNWPGNLDVSDWNIVNGLFVPRYKAFSSGLIKVEPKTCEDTTIVLGAEGVYRRKSKSLDEFLAKPPRQFRRLFRG